MILARIFFTILILGPLVIGIFNIINRKKNPTSSLVISYYSILNSAVAYALAYNVIFFFQELFLVLGKKSLGLKATLYHNNHNWEGHHDMDALMQGSGALAIFIIGLICLFWFQRIRNGRSSMKLFALWMAFQGLTQSLLQVMVAFFDPGTDVGQALVGYWHINNNLLIAMAILSIICTILVCIWCIKPMLELSPEVTSLSNPNNRIKYIRFVVVGGAFLGCLLIIPFRVPPITQAISPFLLFVFTIPWIWSMSYSVTPQSQVVNGLKDNVLWTSMVLLMVLLLVFRLLLAPGIEF